MTSHIDGQVQEDRLADRAAIQDLAIAYGYAVDDRDWERWGALFLQDAWIDYTSAGGIAGSRDELVEWMPNATAAFKMCMHSVLTHEIHFTAGDQARGRLHLFNRNEVEWNGELELLDVGGVYEDEYRKIGDTWKFASRVERCTYISGGGFAEMLRGIVADART